MEKLPNFIIQYHKAARVKLMSFPGLKINSFIIKDLNKKQMDNLLDKFKNYPQYYNKFKELFEIELKFRKYENNC